MKEQFVINEQELRLGVQKDGVSRVAVGAGINKEGKLLLVRRSAHDFLGGLYELPGGGVDLGESIEAALAREVQEEVGLTLASVQGMFKDFDYTNEKGEKTRQFNFVIEVEGADVVLDPKEHDKYTWISQSDVETGKIDLTQNIRECIQDYFERFSIGH